MSDAVDPSSNKEGMGDSIGDSIADSIVGGEHCVPSPNPDLSITIPVRQLNSKKATDTEGIEDRERTDRTHPEYSLDQPLLVIIRHGKTEHNKLGLFTGWEDANLAQVRRRIRSIGRRILL